MKQYEYRVIVSDKGFEDFEKKVAEKLDEGWKPIGGIAFNHSYPHQAMARLKEAKQEEQGKSIQEKAKALTANQAMKRLDDLT